jgi:hypothetical protein
MIKNMVRLYFYTIQNKKGQKLAEMLLMSHIKNADKVADIIIKI